MKKLIALLMAIAALTSFSMAEDYDFSSYDTETLNQLEIAIQNELIKRALNNSITTYATAGAYEDQILFRGLDWGMDLNEVREQLVNSGFISNKCKSDSAFYLSPWAPNPNNARSYKECGISLEQYSMPDNVKVAGYNVSNVYLYFLFSLDNGKINRESDKSELYQVKMALKASDYDLAFSDLFNKLSLLYGESVESSDVSGFISLSGGSDHHEYERWAAWYGQNNTAVSLHMEYNKDDDTQLITYGTVTLYYGKTDSETKLLSISQALENEKKELELQKILENAKNVDGL